MWQATMSGQKVELSLMSKETTRGIYGILEMYPMVVKEYFALN